MLIEFAVKMIIKVFFWKFSVCLLAVAGKKHNGLFIERKNKRY